MDGLDSVVQGALVLGFVKKDDGNYECTREQLITLCAMIAQEAIRQARDEMKVE